MTGCRGLRSPAALAAAWIAWRLLRRRRKVRPRLAPDLRIDIAALGENGPPPGRPQLEFYNLPVRLAAVVLAPVGLERELPGDDRLAAYFDSIVPGLDQVVRRHKPLVRRWPNQVSTRGFANVFFANARLPGTFGKGTPWSSVAGVFRVEEQPVMAGLVLSRCDPIASVKRPSPASTSGSAVSASGGVRKGLYSARDEVGNARSPAFRRKAPGKPPNGGTMNGSFPAAESLMAFTIAKARMDESTKGGRKMREKQMPSTLFFPHFLSPFLLALSAFRAPLCQ